jgi:hypothetical protein
MNLSFLVLTSELKNMTSTGLRKLHLLSQVLTEPEIFGNTSSRQVAPQVWSVQERRWYWRLLKLKLVCL